MGCSKQSALVRLATLVLTAAARDFARARECYATVLYGPCAEAFSSALALGLTSHAASGPAARARDAGTLERNETAVFRGPRKVKPESSLNHKNI